MLDPANTNTAAELSISVVLFHSPIEQLRALIESVVASLQRADLHGVEIVCLDNSCDVEYGERCEQMLAEFISNKHLRVKYMSADRNAGYGAGHNRAMSGCSAPVHLILNPDVELAEDAIPLALETMAAKDGLALLAPVGFNGTGEPEYLAKAYPSVWVLGLRAFAPAWLKRFGASSLARYELRDRTPSERLRPVTLASGCCVWVRRALFDRVGGFDERYFLYFEDYDLSLKLTQLGEVAEHSQIRIVHHGGDAARKGVRHIRWFTAGAIRFFNRWGWKWLG